MTSSPPASKASPTTGSYIGAGGLALFRQTWRPPKPSRGTLALVHGLGEHSGLHPYLVDHLVAAGWAVDAFDLRGHGRSPGQRAYIDRWAELREDLGRFLDVIRAEAPGQPIFLLGHSLGGLIVLDHALDHPEGLHGVIAVSPPLGNLSIPKPLLALARLVSRVWPRLSLRTGMDLTMLARDPEVVAAVLADPLFHRVGTARLATEVERTIARVQREAARFSAPLLVIHGGNDRLVPPDGSRQFVPKVGGADKAYREYPDDYHALFADFGRETVLRDVEQWMAERSGAATIRPPAGPDFRE